MGSGRAGVAQDLHPRMEAVSETQAPLMEGEGAGDGHRRLSVIVAVHNGGPAFEAALGALVGSTLPRSSWELIVVDDGSTDRSAEIAAEYADILIRLPGKPRGPAYARNRGCEASQGELLAFLDADVCVHPDVLERFVELFDTDSSVSAAFGSYDQAPPSAGLVSQFRNLLHHHVHQNSSGEAQTFWAGCGAIRRSALLDVEMFNEWHYSRPQIEDIEIGRRLRNKGHQIVLRPEILGTHLKQWSLRSMLATDFASRGVPWTRVLLQEGKLRRFDVLNLSRRERISAIAATTGVIGLIAAIALRSRTVGLVSLLVLTLIVLNHTRFYQLLYRRGGVSLAVASVPLLLAYYVTGICAAIVGYLAHVVLGEPQALPEVEAEAAMELQIWPPSPRSPADHPWARPPDRRLTDPPPAEAQQAAGTP